jgi:hypothetical protein
MQGDGWSGIGLGVFRSTYSRPGGATIDIVSQLPCARVLYSYHVALAISFINKISRIIHVWLTQSVYVPLSFIRCVG